MKWNETSGYYEFKAAQDGVMRQLGIGKVDYLIREELGPYLTKILKYLNTELIKLGDDAEILEKLNKIFDIFDDGSDKIVTLMGQTLAEEIGVIEADEGEEEESDDYTIVAYEQDRFIFCWTNVMSCLVTRLKLQYASLLYQPVKQGCGCLCPPGETYKDWEAYNSGHVYAEDEEYSKFDYGYNAYSTTASWRASLSNEPDCTCGHRIRTENE